jgi:predicted acetyltransferase
MNVGPTFCAEVADDDVEMWQRPLLAAFGIEQTQEAVAAARNLHFLARFGFKNAQAYVASLGLFEFEITIPGGAFLPMAGVTMVAVEPTSRRQGLMRRLLDHGLAFAIEREMPVAGLFASDGAIYGPFGFGLATQWLGGEISRHTANLNASESTQDSGVEITRIEIADAEPTCAAIWQQVRARTPGTLSRPSFWWQQRRFFQAPWRRIGNGPLSVFVAHCNGEPVGYLLAKIGSSGPMSLTATLHIVELVSHSSAALEALWNFALRLDLQETIAFGNFTRDHPILLRLRRPETCHLRVHPALYLRILQVEKALAARSWGPGDAVLEIHDPSRHRSNGRFRITNEGVERTTLAPDLEMNIDTLSSAYLGGVSIPSLARCGKVRVHEPKAIMQANSLFSAGIDPWCADPF